MAGTASRRGLIARQYCAQPGFEEKEVTETLRVPVAPEIYHEIVQKSLGCGDGARQGWKSGLEKGGRVRTGCGSCALL